jgi:hypothetical protein
MLNPQHLTSYRKEVELSTSFKISQWTIQEEAYTWYNEDDMVTVPTCTEKEYATNICKCGNSYVDTGWKYSNKAANICP